MSPIERTPAGLVTTDTETAFLGCLMRCPASAVRRLTSDMSSEDFYRPIASIVFTLACELAATEVPPEPCAVLAHARRGGHLSGEHKHKQFAEWLIDTYRAAPDPVSGDYLKISVLELAFRRALYSHAQRLAQRAEHSEIDDLTNAVTLDDYTRDLWQRHTEASSSDQPAPLAPTQPSQAVTGQLRDEEQGPAELLSSAAPQEHPGFGRSPQSPRVPLSNGSVARQEAA